MPTRRGRRGRRSERDVRRAVGARVPGRGRPAGRRARPWRPRRDPAWKRPRLGAGLLGRPACRGGRGPGQHAVQGGRGRVRRFGLRRRVLLLPGRRAPRRRAGGRGRPRARRPGCDLLHERDHGLPEGRHDLARELPREYRERLPLRRRRQGRGTGAGDADQRAALPRHRVQLAAAGGARARRPRLRAPQRARSRGVPADRERGGRPDGHLGARDLPRPRPSSGLRRGEARPRALGLLRRRADRRRPGARDHGRVPRGAGRQRLRAHGDLVADLVPAPREAAEHADSVGFAMPVVDLALHEPDPETSVGELLVRGENVVRAIGTSPRRAPRLSSTVGFTPATSRGSTTTDCSTSSIAPRT